MFDLTNREIAQVLASLRHWQETNVEGNGMPHFQNLDPLSLDEIDGLCDKLNCGANPLESQDEGTEKASLGIVTFNCADDITEYWKLLGDLGLQFHLDDEASEIFEGRSCHDVIVQNHKAMWAFCEANDVNPWDHVEINFHEEHQSSPLTSGSV